MANRNGKKNRKIAGLNKAELKRLNRHKNVKAKLKLDHTRR